MPGVGRRYFERRGHSHQLRKRPGSHLLHDVTAMNLERDLADAAPGNACDTFATFAATPAPALTDSIGRFRALHQVNPDPRRFVDAQRR
jgi:hypothetical protein